MRISDFHTTGISGAANNERGTPFYNLTKGSGVSDKGRASGGSKGIGKFASFVVSTTNTVFYSTRANDGSCGSIGITKLRSVPIDNDDDLMTLGIGYFAKNDKNYPILEELHLDESFTRKEKEFGTDVFIIGFSNEDGWEKSIITKVLESFMVAILRGKLEVVVGDYELTKATIHNVIYNSELLQEKEKNDLKEIRAQYELLQGVDNVEVKTLDIMGSSVTVYVKQYGAQEEKNGIQKCIMVRYPYMKITHMTTGAFLPYSALCVIEDNKLNEKLRQIENPQHTDWELKRLNDYPEERRDTHRHKLAMERSVKEFIQEVLCKSTSDITDIEGAGEFLPSQEDIGDNVGSIFSNDQVIIRPMSRNKPQNPKTEKSGNNGEGYEFSTGDLDPFDEGEPGRLPKRKKKHKPTPNPNPKPAPNPDDPKVISGDKPILHKIPLSGVRFRTLVRDKSNGLYECIFTSPISEKECDFSIRICGEGVDKYPISIIDAQINGNACEIKGGKIINMSVEKGNTYKVSYKVDSDEMFASEVIMNAYRK